MLDTGCSIKMWERPPASMIAAGSRSHKHLGLPSSIQDRAKRLSSISHRATHRIKRECTMKERVQQAIDKIRPMLQQDGGDVELVDVQDGIVFVRLRGACAGCPMSQMTLKNGIEKLLKREVPEVISVQAAQ
jgi:Fe-S cluster biogenesis protein NfuA